MIYGSGIEAAIRNKVNAPRTFAAACLAFALAVALLRWVGLLPT